MKLLLNDAEMDAQLGRTVIGANSMSADHRETMATGSRVPPSD